MKCPILASCSYLIPIIIAALVTVLYLRFRSQCCTTTTCAIPPKVMQPTTITLYGLRYPFSLPALPYNYNALEPHVDAETMQLHYTKHHQAYIDNVNNALQAAPEFQKYTIEELLANLEALPPSIRDAVRNHGGGHFNHTLFWDLMTPTSTGMPTKVIADKITTTFGSFAAFKEQFNKAAGSRFGSGWAWLCVTPEKTLTIIATANQDTPLEKGLYPILALDVWEHAYYLKYRNKRIDYIGAWWNVVNWEYVEKLYNNALKALG